MRHERQIKDLAQELKGRKRILLWGAMGVGKSTLPLAAEGVYRRREA